MIRITVKWVWLLFCFMTFSLWSGKGQTASSFTGRSVLDDFDQWLSGQDNKVIRLRKILSDASPGEFKFEPPRRSLCTNTILNTEQMTIERCLKLITVDPKAFVQKAERVRHKRGESGKCAKYVADASVQTGWTRQRPNGCTGRDKAKFILEMETNFIDIAPLLRPVIGASTLVGAAAQSEPAVLAGLIAPEGSLLSFTGNNRGRCAGGPMQGLGHFTSKVSNQQFCHFICDDCPAVASRKLDRILIKLKPEYREMLKGPQSLKMVCDEVLARADLDRSSNQNQIQKKGVGSAQ